MSAAPRILCKAGPSLSSLQPVAVNESALPISSDVWEGSVSVRLKDYRGPKGHDGRKQPKEPFEKQGDTWSIAFEGRWKQDTDVDEILFGNVWQKPIRDYLPYGTSAALRFVRYVDPSLSCDLYADKPWALSPLFATLQSLSAQKVPADAPLPAFTPSSFPEDLTPLLAGDPAAAAALHGAAPAQRRAHFADEAHRRGLAPLARDVLLRGDFSHGFLDFATLALALPGGLSFSLAKYWNGEPVVFSCQRRRDGETFFVVTFELLDDEGDAVEAAAGAAGAPGREGEDEPSSDVD
ncbi:hypothetical protein JCM1841_002934 [Sporobolomyces salmonicolor]